MFKECWCHLWHHYSKVFWGLEAGDNNPILAENYSWNNLLLKPELMQTGTLKQAGVYWSCDASDLSFVRISSGDNRTAEVFEKAAPGAWWAGC